MRVDCALLTLAALRAPLRQPPLGVRLCAEPPPPSPSLAGLIDDALRLTESSDAERQSLVETTVVSWVPSERQRLSDELSDLLSERAASVQADALKLHERGEDYSEYSATLQTLVDMTVQVKLLVRQLQKASQG